jgi:hypothetical protein
MALRFAPTARVLYQNQLQKELLTLPMQIKFERSLGELEEAAGS